MTVMWLRLFSYGKHFSFKIRQTKWIFSIRMWSKILVNVFSREDQPWVSDNFMRYLEDENNYTLCVHQRDAIPEQASLTNIVTAIDHSRRMVMVLSK